MSKDKRRIGDMKNFGPEAEQDFAAVGITHAYQVIELGVEKAFLQMLEGRAKNKKSISCVNPLYLYAIYGAIHDVDWRAIPTKKKDEYKKLTKIMRHSGLY